MKYIWDTKNKELISIFNSQRALRMDNMQIPQYKNGENIWKPNAMHTREIVEQSRQMEWCTFPLVSRGMHIETIVLLG